VRIPSTAAAFRLKPEATPFVVGPVSNTTGSSAIVQAFIGFAAILVVSSAAVGQVAARDPRYTDVYTSGEKGYNTFRIPSVIATSRGTLLAFAEARREGAGDAGDIDLVLKRSEDGGISWSPLQVVGDNGANTFGNPCPVVDRATGAIWLLTTQNRGTDREKDIIAGTSQAGRSAAVLHSTDDGVTWSAPTDIPQA
jgi:sialidase-1